MTYQLPPPPESVTPPPEKKRGWGWFVAGAAVILLGIGAVTGGSNESATPAPSPTATITDTATPEPYVPAVDPVTKTDLARQQLVDHGIHFFDDTSDFKFDQLAQSTCKVVRKGGPIPAIIVASRYLKSGGDAGYFVGTVIGFYCPELAS